MDIKKLTRDADRVNAQLHITDDDTIITKKGCKIYIPTRFASSSHALADVGQTISTVGILAIVIDDQYYGVMSVPSRVTLCQDSINIVKVDGVDYYEFVFSAGSVVIENTELVLVDTLPYYIYSEIIDKGNIPWYMGYVDLGLLLSNVFEYSGIRLGPNNVIIEVIVSTIARRKDDLTKYYRHIVEDMYNPKELPTIVPMRNIIYGTNTLTSRVMGSYPDLGIMSALTNPSTKSEGIEELLRR